MKKGMKLTILGVILLIVGAVLCLVGGYMMVEAIYGYGAMDFWMIITGCGCVIFIIGAAIACRKGVRVHIVKEDEE